MNKILNTIISIGIIFTLAFVLIMFSRTKAGLHKKIEILKNSIDSIKSIESRKQTIQQTMLAAYPQLSEFEAQAYGDIIYDFCEKRYKVPFVTVLAIFNVESQWNPTLISSKKCRGLGQLSEGASTDAFRRLGIRYIQGVTEWYDINNLAGSLEYFCYLYKEKGDSSAIRNYIGGGTWNKAKPGGEREQNIRNYAQLVAQEELKVKETLAELRKLTYISKGVEVYAAEHQSSSSKR